MRAPLLLCMVTGLSFAGARAHAGPWSSQPLVGVVAEYASNPALAVVGPSAETHAALVLDLPVYYDGDVLHYALIPRVRYSDATGYSSITSNYLHLDTSAKLTRERDVTTLTGALYQDSSLLYAGELSNGVGVRRDLASLDLNWQHSLTERAQFQIDGNAVRTRYAQDAQLNSLVDYDDVGASPGFSYAVTELTTLRLVGSVSRYKALDGFTDSNSTQLQLGFDHHLDELWLLTTLVGYTKSTDQYNYGFITLDTSQNGTVYSVNLTRQSEKLAAVFGASRALTPTGFAFLARQESVNGLLNYTHSERLTLGLGVSWADISEPSLTGGGSSTRRFYSGDASASWHWTEQWVVSLHLVKFGQEFPAAPGQRAVSPTSNGVNLQISRQFYQTNQ